VYSVLLGGVVDVFDAIVELISLSDSTSGIVGDSGKAVGGTSFQFLIHCWICSSLLRVSFVKGEEIRTVHIRNNETSLLQEPYDLLCCPSLLDVEFRDPVLMQIQDVLDRQFRILHAWHTYGHISWVSVRSDQIRSDQSSMYEIK
jgi:hypothetical protein